MIKKIQFQDKWMVERQNRKESEQRVNAYNEVDYGPLITVKHTRDQKF